MANVNETTISNSTSEDWKHWCRLCAKEDAGAINLFTEINQGTAPIQQQQQQQGGTAPAKFNFRTIDFIRFVEEFFQIHIGKSKDLPHWLCNECSVLVSQFIKFAEHVRKVQIMYDTLNHYGENRTLNLREFREKYNLIGDELLAFHSLEKKPAVEKFNAADTAVPKPLNSVVKTELIMEEAQSELIFNEFEFKCEFQDPIGDMSENISEAECTKLENNYIEQFSESHAAKKHIKKLRRRYCTSEESKQQKYSCNDCSMRFQRIGNYRTHMKKKHGGVINIDPLACPDCSRSFNTQYNLNRHIKTHRPHSEKRIFPCPQCDRKFQTKDYVARHIKFVHEDIRPFICEECGEGTRTETTLREHMLIHTDLAPFECDICKKRFKNQARLKNHMEIHSSNKHICKECGLQLNSRVTLNRHMLVHSDVMRHKCDYCGRAFKRAKTLKNHLILHSGLKPYSCDFCDKTFANGANCRTHKRKSHPEELAALEAAGGKAYTRNIPKLAVLKTVTRSAENLTPVVSKHSGNFSLGRKPNPSTECIETNSSKSLAGMGGIATPCHTTVSIENSLNK